MNRRQRRLFAKGKRWAAGGPPDEGYALTAEMTLTVLRLWLSTYPERERPRFRFPEVPIAASVVDFGSRVAMNASARELVDLWIAAKGECGLGDYPTLMMVRVCLEAERIPWDRCGFADLGLQPMGGGGGWQ